MVKTLATSVVLFLSLFFASFANGQAISPTLGRNNVWTGTNSFLYQKLVLNHGNSCQSGQAMIGYQADFTPICATFAGGGISTLNGLSGNVVVVNGDDNLSVSTNGQNIQIFCPGCSGGGSTTPGGSTGAIQYNAGGSPNTFGGVNITGIVFGQGSLPPRQAVAGSDYSAPFTIYCSPTSGLSCSFAGSTWTLVATGAAGEGNVDSAINGQVGGYLSTGQTISGAPNLFVLNPSWNINQMTGLFSRFSGSAVTSWSITSNVVTFQSVNAYNPGDVVDLVNFPTSTFFNNAHVTVLSSGLSNTQFEASFSHANGSATESGIASINIPAQIPTSQGLVVIPPGMVDQPSNAFVNTSLVGVAGQGLDWRRGYAFQQASIYGIKCDANRFFVTLTEGSNQVNVGSDFSIPGYSPVGATMTVGQQVGYGNTGTQNVWTPTVTAGLVGALTLSSNAPFNYTGFVYFGTNNQAALQRAFDEVGGTFPLWFPQCSMLTDTVRWNGANVLGQQMQSTSIIGFPGHDIFQQQDGLPITAWSINASSGVTTFTVPAYAAHSILAQSDYINAPSLENINGDSINLRNFPTSTFFNGQNVNIATHPTPTTFTVNSAFGQGTSSGTETGVAAPNTAANTNGLRVENVGFDVDNSIDASFGWNWYAANGTLTVEPPYYRPVLLWTQRQNNPFNGWGVGAVNGVANITQNSSVICVPTTSGARSPAVSSTIVFPYQTGGLFTATVSSTAGSCSTGFTPFTLSAALPNTSGYTASQAEWFTYTTPQTLSVAMAGTITLPYTITLTLPFPPVPGMENGVSSHGRVRIGSQEWDYMGDTFGGSAGGNPTITLRNGPTTVNGGAGYAGGTIVFPLNPCQAMYNNPWPVVPTINSGQATPLYATYYAGDCGGNAALSLPAADAISWTPESSGWSIAHFIDLACNNTTVNSLGNPAPGSMCIYEAGNNTGYGNTLDDIRGNGLWGGFMQGPASVNQHGVRAVGPTSTGQSIKNCTFRTDYAIALVNMEQSTIDRCDTYSTEISPYDGTQVGATMGLNLGLSISEQDGGGVTNTAQFTVKDYNNEPENGNHFEFPASFQSDATIASFPGSIFEGGYNIFGGSYQTTNGTQLSNPVFNYGANNYFPHMMGLNTGYFFTSYLTQSFYNWGTFSQGDCSNGNSGGLSSPCSYGLVEIGHGHDIWASMMGDNVHPNENILGGMIPPDEFGETGRPLVYDSTELWWAKASVCALPNNGSQCNMGEWDGFNGYIFIGPHQRITDTKMVLKANLKATSGSPFTFNLQIMAGNPFSYSTCTPNFSLVNVTVTVGTSWTPIQIPVDFTGYASCAMTVQYIEDGSTGGTFETGYFNFVPFASQAYMPLATHTVGSACPVAGEFSLDATNLWICKPSTGVTFGAGTWDYYGTAH